MRKDTGKHWEANVHHEVATHVVRFFDAIIHLTVDAEAEEDTCDDRLEHLREDESNHERSNHRHSNGNLLVANIQAILMSKA